MTKTKNLKIKVNKKTYRGPKGADLGLKVGLRLRCTGVHLTYKTHLDLVQAIDNLQALIIKETGVGLKYWSFVHEAGKSLSAQITNGKSDELEEEGVTNDHIVYDHTHIALKFKMILARTNCERLFDLEGIHPHIRVFKDNSHVSWVFHEYHHKAPILLRQSKDLPPKEDDFDQIVRADTLAESCRIMGIVPRTVSDIWRLRCEPLPKIPFQHAYPNAKWTLKLPDNFEAIYVWGDTNTGKTQCALSYFKWPLLVSSPDDLKNVVWDEDGIKGCNGIVYDDMDNIFSTWPRTNVIHLLDYESARSIDKCRHKPGFIPAYVKKIVTSNKPFDQVMPFDEHNAIRRRFQKIIHVTGKTYEIPLQIAEEIAEEMPPLELIPNIIEPIVFTSSEEAYQAGYEWNNVHHEWMPMRFDLFNFDQDEGVTDNEIDTSHEHLLELNEEHERSEEYTTSLLEQYDDVFNYIIDL